MSWQLFDRVRAFFRNANVYQSDQVLQDQGDLSRVVSGNEFIDLSKQNALLQQTTMQINRLERYKDFDQMSEVGEISLALDTYSDEASMCDPEFQHAIRIRAKSKRVQDALEHLFYETLLIDRVMRPIIRYLCKYGDFASEIVPNSNRDSIQSIRFINIYNFVRVETKYGDLVGFYYNDPLSAKPIFLHPWQVMHLRLTSFENLYHPYGQSILDGARKDFKRLRLMEDAALVYRLTRSSERRVFTIPVGNLPVNQIDEYIQRIAQKFKKKKFVDPATGAVNERYNPLIQDDDFFLPKRPDGAGPTVETLPGAENLDSIADIEYFKKKMIAALKIPFSRVGLGGEGASESDGRSLSSVSPDFAKAIQWIQREVAIGLKKIAIVHLALNGFTVEDIKDFDIVMTASSAIDELYRIETWNSRAEIIGRLKETQMFDDRWILRRFTHMNDDEIKEMENRVKEQLAKGMGEGGMGGLGGGLSGLGGGPGGPGLGGIGLPLPESSNLYRIIDKEDENYVKLITEAEATDFSNVVEQKEIITESNKIIIDGLFALNEFGGLKTADGEVQCIIEDKDREEVKQELEELLTSKALVMEVSDDDSEPEIKMITEYVEG